MHNKNKKLFELIFNTKKKMSRSKNKSEKIELQQIKDWGIQMLEDLGETYVEL